jgi:hypothetical protein
MQSQVCGSCFLWWSSKVAARRSEDHLDDTKTRRAARVRWLRLSSQHPRAPQPESERSTAPCHGSGSRSDRAEVRKPSRRHEDAACCGRPSCDDHAIPARLSCDEGARSSWYRRSCGDQATQAVAPHSPSKHRRRWRGIIAQPLFYSPHDGR